MVCEYISSYSLIIDNTPDLQYHLFIAIVMIYVYMAYYTIHVRSGPHASAHISVLFRVLRKSL